jgi:beta-glucosidase/6-phospho-beta-glucosidase/beta-galactosidase
MGLTAFRLGIEWSRVQPGFSRERTAPPPFDFAALDHYAKILASCRAHGLEPVVTLHHFVHPAWLGSDPWLDDTTPELFAAFVECAVTYINKKLVDEFRTAPLRIFISINEPNMLIVNTYVARLFPGKGRLGFKSMDTAGNQLLIAHVRAYNTLHDLYAREGWDAPRVTFNNYSSDMYWSDKFLLDLMAARERGIARGDTGGYILGKLAEFKSAFRAAKIPLHKDVPYYFGAVMKKIVEWIGRRRFDADRFSPLLDAIYASPRERLFDYLGLDYYDPFSAHIFRMPVFWDHEYKNKSFRAWVLNSITSKWWDWRVLPRGLHFFCKYYAEDFGRAVLIAENGMATRRLFNNTASRRHDRMTRSRFLRLHVHEVMSIIHDGVPLIGYLHWSLFDNYEWGSYTPRFGLFSIDYTKGSDRLVEDHNGDRPSETYAALICEAREKIKAASAK